MKQIFVEPAKLEEVASRVSQLNDDYERIYRSLYSQVDKMSSSWSGKDNTAFTNQIYSYQHDMKQISIIMLQYVEFLRNSAKAYSEVQNELYAQASKLKG